MDTKNELQHNVLHQRTLGGWVTIGGIGLHTGERVELSIGPAPADTGIVFERSDLPAHARVKACPESVVDSAFCTVLGNNGTRVSTVEHLLAALFGLGVDNAHVVLDGEEVPILDGSAQPFIQLIQRAGVRSLHASRSWIRLTRPVAIRDGDRVFELLPARSLSVDCTVDFDHPLVTDQKLKYKHDARNFEQEIAPARTFGFLKDVGEMKRNGLARGGSLDNAVVIDSFSILNPGGLRFPDEFVRHKMLDIMGDLALLGGVLAARVVAHKSGHSLHHSLVRRLSEESDCSETVRIAPDQLEMNLPFDLAPFRLAGLQGA
jgi:UDP-3-O-[3-hydroxymyristoyl] N-acetylglucosamine deacetylase